MCFSSEGKNLSIYSDDLDRTRILLIAPVSMLQIFIEILVWRFSHLAVTFSFDLAVVCLRYVRDLKHLPFVFFPMFH